MGRSVHWTSPGLLSYTLYFIPFTGDSYWFTSAKHDDELTRKRHTLQYADLHPLCFGKHMENINSTFYARHKISQQPLNIVQNCLVRHRKTVRPRLERALSGFVHRLANHCLPPFKLLKAIRPPHRPARSREWLSSSSQKASLLQR